MLESWKYDPTTLRYDLTLRSGVKFHNGETLTSKDVVASLERYRANSSGAQFNKLVSQMTAVDDQKLTITVKEPTGAIPALLATPDTPAYIMPASLLTGLAPDKKLDNIVCTGPYKVDSFAADQQAVLSRFDDYNSRSDATDGAAGKKTAYADSIKFVPYNSANTLNEVRTNAVDIAPQFVSLDQLAVYEADPALTPKIQEGGGFSLIKFNLKDGLMTNKTLRQAVLNAVDPKAIATQTLGGLDHYKDSSSLFPEGSEWYSEEGQDVFKNKDPKAAADLLKQAGYDGTPVRLLYRPESDTYGPLLRQQLEAAGFKVDMKATDAATFTATRTDPTAWDMFITDGTKYSDPLTVPFIADTFPGWWTSEEKTKLMAQVTAGATTAERKPAWDKLQANIWQDLPFIKLGTEPRLAIIGNRVSGFESTQTIRGFYNIWLTS
ncbi:ABC transporter substrate-binding protein [Arthrobacter sp. R3-55]